MLYSLRQLATLWLFVTYRGRRVMATMLKLPVPSFCAPGQLAMLWFPCVLGELALSWPSVTSHRALDC